MDTSGPNSTGAAHTEPPAVCHGSIVSLRKSGFGFIRPVGSSLDLFFHFSELSSSIDASQLTTGQPVRYILGTDARTGRACACHVQPASPHEVCHERVSEQQFLGRVIQWPQRVQDASQGTPATRSDPGILRYIDANKHVAHLTFTAADIQRPAECTPSSSQQPIPHAAQHADSVSMQTAATNASQPGGGLQGDMRVQCTPWVLFRLSHKITSKTATSTASKASLSGTARCGARSGFRAVDVEPIQHPDNLPPEYKPQFTLLDVLAELHPR